MRCRNCGFEYPDDAPFCPRCGKSRDDRFKRHEAYVASSIATLVFGGLGACFAVGVIPLAWSYPSPKPWMWFFFAVFNLPALVIGIPFFKDWIKDRRSRPKK